MVQSAPSSCIAIAIDEAYAWPAAVLLNSIVTSLGADDEFDDPRVRINVFGCGLSSRMAAALGAVCAQDRRVGFTYRELTPANLERLATLPTWHHLSAAAYARLLIPRILAEEDRILYLDADIVLLRDIRHLQRESIPPGCVLSAARGLNMSTMPEWLVSTLDERDVGPNPPYFNSGVMLIDGCAWRDRRVGARAIEFVTAHPRFPLPDEVALNAVLCGSWRQLDPRWNVYPMTERLATPGFQYLGEDVIPRADLPALEADAWIMHYVSSMKPWTAAFPAGANKRRYEVQEAMVRSIPAAASLRASLVSTESRNC